MQNIPQLPLECWSLILYFASPTLETLATLSRLNRGIRQVTWSSPAFKSSIVLRILKTSNHFSPSFTPQRIFSFYNLPDAKSIVDILTTAGYTKMASPSALSVALRYGLLNMIRVLVGECRVPVTSEVSYDAVRVASVEALRLLLDLSGVVADSNALLLAAARGDQMVYEMMLETLTRNNDSRTHGNSQRLLESTTSASDNQVGVCDALEVMGIQEDHEQAALRQNSSALQASLVVAVENNHVSIVQFLLEKGVDHPEAVRRAAELDRASIMRVFAHYACLVSRPSGALGPLVPGPPAWVAMVEIAARMGHDNTLRSLLGVSETAVSTWDRYTPTYLNFSRPSVERGTHSSILLEPSVQLAIMNRHKSSVRILLSAGIPGNRLAFSTAISTNQPDILTLLLETSKSHRGNPQPPSGIITFALDRGSLSCIVVLLKHEVRPTATDILFAAKKEEIEDDFLNLLVVFGKMAARESLSLAIHEKVEERTLRRLVRAGATPDEGLLTSLVFLDREESLRIILDESQNLGFKPSPLVMTCAVDAGKTSMVLQLLNFNILGSPSDLYIAARKGFLSIVGALLEKSAGLGVVPLDLAIQRQEEGVIEVLLEKGVQPSKHSWVNAIETGNAGVVGLLLAYRDPLPTSLDHLVLSEAVAKGNLRIVTVLLDSKLFTVTDVLILQSAKTGDKNRTLALLQDAPPNLGPSAINLALHEDSEDAVRVLISCQVKPSLHSFAIAIRKGKTVLLRDLLIANPLVSEVVATLVIRNGTTEMMEMLVKEFNVPVTLVSLLLAMRRGNFEVARYLIEGDFFQSFKGRERLKEAYFEGDSDEIIRLIVAQGEVEDVQSGIEMDV
ncbi:hypothetical protein HDV05_000179 [Chytridiales sp. JEL 0842]|nr:hypothetical protein HDV05_000179 [Chytridiales sp. JEL 0842]